MSRIATALALAISLHAAPALARNPGNPTGGRFADKHPRRNEVNQRVRNQRERINEGERTGQLTPQQANQLRANDRAIKRQEHQEVRANGGQ